MIRSGRSDPGVTAGRSRAAGRVPERHRLTSSDSHVPRMHLWYTFDAPPMGLQVSAASVCPRWNRRFGLRPDRALPPEPGSSTR
jgi:hypothetical protein